MAESPRRPAEAWWFVLPADRKLPPEKQSKFLLEPLTQEERLEVYDTESWTTTDPTTGEVSVRSRAFRQARDLVIRKLRDIQNFPASAPEPFPQNGDVQAKVKYIEKLDDIDLLLIGSEIRDHSALETEVKNF